MAYGLLKGKKGIVFGALNDQSIAWKAALKASEEGAELVLTNTPVSIRLGTIDQLAHQCMDFTFAQCKIHILQGQYSGKAFINSSHF